jgi:PST family polysaccharide transporter
MLMLVVAGLAYPVSLFYSDARLLPIMAAIAIGFPFSGIAVQHQALLRRQMKFAHLATIQIGSSLLSLIREILMALNGFGYWALVAREIARSVLGGPAVGCSCLGSRAYLRGSQAWDQWSGLAET